MRVTTTMVFCAIGTVILLAFLAVGLSVYVAFDSLAEARSLLAASRSDDAVRVWALRASMGEFYGGHMAAGAGLAGFLMMFAAFALQALEMRRQRVEFERQAGALESATRETKKHKKLLRQQLEIERQSGKRQRELERARVRLQIGIEHVMCMDAVAATCRGMTQTQNRLDRIAHERTGDAIDADKSRPFVTDVKQLERGLDDARESMNAARRALEFDRVRIEAAFPRRHADRLLRHHDTAMRARTPAEIEVSMRRFHADLREAVRPAMIGVEERVETRPIVELAGDGVSG